MKIPVWLATILVSGTFGLAIASFEALRADVNQLKLDVAVIKARTGPAAPHIAAAQIP